MCSGRASAMVTSPPAMPTAAKYVAATTRSGTTRVAGGLQRLHSLDLKTRGPRTAHDRTHVAEHGGQVRHLGFLGRVLNDGRALGQHRRHEQIVRRRVARVLQDDPGADQPASRHRAAHLAVGRLEAGAHGAESAEVEIDRPVPEVVPTRERHPHRAATGEEEAEDDDRGPHLLEELVGPRRHQLAIGRSGHAHIPVVEALDLRTDTAQHLGHDVDVGDARDVGEHSAALGEQAARHQLQRRILRAACPDRAPERAAGLDDDLIHDPKYRRWRVAGPARDDRRPTMVRAVVTTRQAPDRNLAMDLVRVTEAAAMAASRWMGRGDKLGADGAAVEAMRTVLSSVPMDGIVVIGEGEKDNAPMLFNGEKIGDGTPL